MAEALSDDGVTLHWEDRGASDGPLLVAATQCFAPTSVFEGLWADLARDHRLVTYDLRGVGQSDRVGPYELDRDARDLAALSATGCGSSPTTTIPGSRGSWPGARASWCPKRV